jgi:hypothetical protein
MRPEGLPIVGTEWVENPLEPDALRHCTVTKVYSVGEPWFVQVQYHQPREGRVMDGRDEPLADFLDRYVPRTLWETMQRPNRNHTGPQIAGAWHDVTCPEAEDCPSRSVHMLSAPLVNSGVLQRFLDRLGAA